MVNKGCVEGACANQVVNGQLLFNGGWCGGGCGVAVREVRNALGMRGTRKEMIGWSQM